MSTNIEGLRTTRDAAKVSADGVVNFSALMREYLDLYDDEVGADDTTTLHADLRRIHAAALSLQANLDLVIAHLPVLSTAELTVAVGPSSVSVDELTTVTIDLTESYDPENLESTVLINSISQTGGPSGTLGATTTLTPTFTAPSVSVDGNATLVATVKAADGTRVSDPLTITVAIKNTPPPTGTDVVRINCGSTSPFIDSAGKTWAADSLFANGNAHVDTGIAISGTTDDTLFNSQRWGTDFSYNVPLLDSVSAYVLSLRFAEVLDRLKFVGGRVFDVEVEGAVSVNDLDIHKKVGGDAALTIERNITVSESAPKIANIRFRSSVDAAKVCGLYIRTGSDAASDPADLNPGGGPPTATLIGCYAGNTPSTNHNTLEAALGHQFTTATCYTTRSGTWATQANFSNVLNAWKPYKDARQGFRLEISVAPVTAASRSYTSFLAGAYDSDVRLFFQRCIDAGHGDAIIRWGWEFNGSWFEFGSGATGWNSTNFKNVWIRAHGIASALSGANFDWSFCPNAGPSGTSAGDTTLWYPGDAYVDSIGIDKYDAFTGCGLTGEARFTAHKNETYGLGTLYNFATARNKPFMLGEYGCWPSGSSCGGGDSADFMTRMGDYMKAHPIGTSHHNVWGLSDGGALGLINAPNARAAWGAAW